MRFLLGRGEHCGPSYTAICSTTTKTVRLPNGVSIFRAELYAITMALNIIYRRKENKFIMFSDSMSSLQAVKSFRLELDLVYQIIKLEGKYSLESTDPRESEIRAHLRPPRLFHSVMQKPPAPNSQQYFTFNNNVSNKK